ncbi:hypothetical protein CCUS01_05424 [Colletotrichum cuscutae]|uniref:Uncharacterized protein n=1 Tax=Colletotrichum cuscutae TaxID=1209917 RepID=A0AAI9V9S1_9PEZI|nr:hypothetical protein CCUS01_05424 [Colletotrichum cuscutae]
MFSKLVTWTWRQVVGKVKFGTYQEHRRFGKGICQIQALYRPQYVPYIPDELKLKPGLAKEGSKHDSIINLCRYQDAQSPRQPLIKLRVPALKLSNASIKPPESRGRVYWVNATWSMFWTTSLTMIHKLIEGASRTAFSALSPQPLENLDSALLTISRVSNSGESWDLTALPSDITRQISWGGVVDTQAKLHDTTSQANTADGPIEGTKPDGLILGDKSMSGPKNRSLFIIRKSSILHSEQALTVDRAPKIEGLGPFEWVAVCPGFPTRTSNIWSNLKLQRCHDSSLCRMHTAFRVEKPQSFVGIFGISMKSIWDMLSETRRWKPSLNQAGLADCSQSLLGDCHDSLETYFEIKLQKDQDTAKSNPPRQATVDNGSDMVGHIGDRNFQVKFSGQVRQQGETAIGVFGQARVASKKVANMKTIPSPSESLRRASRQYDGTAGGFKSNKRNRHDLTLVAPYPRWRPRLALTLAALIRTAQSVCRREGDDIHDRTLTGVLRVSGPVQAKRIGIDFKHETTGCLTPARTAGGISHSKPNSRNLKPWSNFLTDAMPISCPKDSGRGGPNSIDAVSDTAFEVPKYLIMGATEAESGECGIDLPVVGLMVVRRGSRAPWKAIQKVGTKGCLQREKSAHGWTATVRRRFAVWFLVEIGNHDPFDHIRLSGTSSKPPCAPVYCGSVPLWEFHPFVDGCFQVEEAKKFGKSGMVPVEDLEAAARAAGFGKRVDCILSLLACSQTGPRQGEAKDPVNGRFFFGIMQRLNRGSLEQSVPEAGCFCIAWDSRFVGEMEETRDPTTSLCTYLTLKRERKGRNLAWACHGLPLSRLSVRSRMRLIFKRSCYSYRYPYIIMHFNAYEHLFFIEVITLLNLLMTSDSSAAQRLVLQRGVEYLLMSEAAAHILMRCDALCCVSISQRDVSACISLADSQSRYTHGLALLVSAILLPIDGAPSQIPTYLPEVPKVGRYLCHVYQPDIRRSSPRIIAHLNTHLLAVLSRYLGQERKRYLPYLTYLTVRTPVRYLRLGTKRRETRPRLRPLPASVSQRTTLRYSVQDPVQEKTWKCACLILFPCSPPAATSQSASGPVLRPPSSVLLFVFPPPN